MNVLNLSKQNHINKTTGKIAEHLSDKYSPVSTEILLQPFLSRGWEIVSSRTNKKKSREWLTLEHEAFKIGDDTVRIEVTNSYDGSTALNIMGGIGRLVCSNGLVVGKDFETFRFIHKGNKIYEKLDNAYEKIVAKLEQLKGKIDALNDVTLDEVQTVNSVRNIYKKLIESDGEKKKVELVSIPEDTLKLTLQTHRDADKGKDAYTVLNVVQENIVRNGVFTAIVEETDKETGEKTRRLLRKRPSEGKLSSLKANEVITDEFLKTVA
jgi:hypothetical protein